MVIEKINFVPWLLIAFDMENKDSINIPKRKRKTALEAKLIRNRMRMLLSRTLHWSKKIDDRKTTNNKL